MEEVRDGRKGVHVRGHIAEGERGRETEGGNQANVEIGPARGGLAPGNSAQGDTERKGEHAPGAPRGAGKE